MGVTVNQLSALQAPFDPSDIEWRAARTGLKNGNGWVQAVAYINNRAVQSRLDTSLGIQNWCNDFKPGANGGVLSGISIKVDDEWITKWDGADNTGIESVKGGISDAMKRAAVQWGIGRYLYSLESVYCPVNLNHGDFYAKIKNDGKSDIHGYWDAPKLPAFARPVKIDQAPEPSAASLITGTAPPKEPEMKEAPATVKQVIKLKTLWTAAGGDITKRDEWMKQIVTSVQADQGIKLLEEKVAAKEEESA